MGRMTAQVIGLALAASGFTALASVAQRRAAKPAPDELSFNWRLARFLIHRPVWFLGIASMILGFVFQVDALRIGSLSLVQPLIATELVIVFGLIALQGRRHVGGRDWLSAIGMVLGLGAFLALARPSTRHLHASSSMWIVAALSTFAFAGIAGHARPYRPDRAGHRSSATRRAALLGVAAATGFGFVAAVVKELSTHLAQGPAGVFDNWSPYVLILSGAVAMFLASNAFQAGYAGCLPTGPDNRRPARGQCPRRGPVRRQTRPPSPGRRRGGTRSHFGGCQRRGVESQPTGAG